MRKNRAVVFLIAFIGALTLSAPSMAQSAAKQRKAELESVSISEIPLTGYDIRRSTDPDPVVRPAYTYYGYIDEIRDADTVRGRVDVGFHIVVSFSYRYYGIDTFEITKSGGKTQSHVDRGYKCRDLMVKWLGSDQVFPKNSNYHKFDEPIRVVVESVKADKYGGRWHFVVHKDGKNLNTMAARSGCAIVTKYETKTPFYDRLTPITPDL